MSRIPINDEAAIVLAEVFCHLTHLESLTLDRNCIGNNGMDDLFRKLCYLTKLTSFDVSPMLYNCQCSALVMDCLRAIDISVPDLYQYVICIQVDTRKDIE